MLVVRSLRQIRHRDPPFPSTLRHTLYSSEYSRLDMRHVSRIASRFYRLSRAMSTSHEEPPSTDLITLTR